MSTATHRTMGLAEAELAARKFRDLFSGCFERWEVAGSVRRRRPDVSDVEHVVIPLWADVPAQDLFGTTTRVNLLLARADMLRNVGDIVPHLYGQGSPRWGDRMRGCDFACMGLISLHEIYSTDEDNWGWQLALRTGPSDFSRGLVTGLLRNGMRNKDGKVWRCVRCRDEPPCERECPHCQGTGLEPVEAMPVRDEQHYFKLAGQEWRRPEERA